MLALDVSSIEGGATVERSNQRMDAYAAALTIVASSDEEKTQISQMRHKAADQFTGDDLQLIKKLDGRIYELTGDIRFKPS
jgi:hypothetical protein